LGMSTGVLTAGSGAGVAASCGGAVTGTSAPGAGGFGRRSSIAFTVTA
jgi:hypothetical protein